MRKTLPPELFQDSIARRIDTRLRWMGWFRSHLCAMIAYDERPHDEAWAPLHNRSVRAYLSGEISDLSRFKVRAAKAMGVAPEALEPGAPFEDLLAPPPRPWPDNIDAMLQAAGA